MDIANTAFPYAGEVGLAVAVLLTVMVYSYLVLDNNVLFRIASHILVGVAVGYAVVVAVENVLWPRLLALPTNLTLLVPFLLCLFLLVRPARSLAWFSNYPLALMLGVGAGLAIVGAVSGTLIPQALGSATAVHWDSANAWGTINGLLIFAGVLFTILSFYFTAEQDGPISRVLDGFRVRLLGRFFIAVALGALFASLLVSRLSLLVGRIEFLIESTQTAMRSLGIGM
ncbi:MAG: hypothetical protein KKA73_00915 [Chloroflexi bacterium]|nr:hypothetical protein [Chloroflexota bacterium]MBU1746224.1 hypothetical protein [Chloroflexota bacterium]MBU1877589.1 hypothetical protein [Chloroflexota bacterium]